MLWISLHVAEDSFYSGFPVTASIIPGFNVGIKGELSICKIIFNLSANTLIRHGIPERRSSKSGDLYQKIDQSLHGFLRPIEKGHLITRQEALARLQ